MWNDEITLIGFKITGKDKLKQDLTEEVEETTEEAKEATEEVEEATEEKPKRKKATKKEEE